MIIFIYVWDIGVILLAHLHSWQHRLPRSCSFIDNEADFSSGLGTGVACGDELEAQASIPKGAEGEAKQKELADKAWQVVTDLYVKLEGAIRDPSQRGSFVQPWKSWSAVLRPADCCQAHWTFERVLLPAGTSFGDHSRPCRIRQSESYKDSDLMSSWNRINGSVEPRRDQEDINARDFFLWACEQRQVELAKILKNFDSQIRMTLQQVVCRIQELWPQLTRQLWSVKSKRQCACGPDPCANLLDCFLSFIKTWIRSLLTVSDWCSKQYLRYAVFRSIKPCNSYHLEETQQALVPT